MDLGHELTEQQLKALEQRIKKEYETAVLEMQKKLRDYLQKTEAQRKIQFQQWQAGKITEKEYQDWCYRHRMMGKRWEQMRDTLAEDLMHTKEIAMSIAKETMPEIYATNANFALYQIEHDAKIDTGLTLYNHNTAEYLLGDQRQLMPLPSEKKAREIAADKAKQWDQQKIQSAVLQGVLQGESPYAIAERLRQVGQMEYSASIRYARTMTTSAESAGRYESFRQARDLGVDLTIEWQATLDHRTRHDHRLMHGQRTTVDEPFLTPDGYTIYYPADCTGRSTAPQHEIWNCRCSLLAWVKGYEHDTIRSSPKMGDMTYEEWLEAKPVTKPLPTDPDKQEKKVASKATKKQKAEPKLKEEPKRRTFEEILGKAYSGNSYTQEELRQIAQMYEAMPDYLQEFYAKYGGELMPILENNRGKVPRKNTDFGYFSSYEGSSGRVHLLPKRDVSGRIDQNPYELGVHEYAHNMDFLAGGKNKFNYLSNQYRDNNGKTFLRIINDDFEAAIRKHVGKEYRDSDIYEWVLGYESKKGGIGAEGVARAALSNWRQINGIDRHSELYRGLTAKLRSATTTADYEAFYLDNRSLFDDVIAQMYSADYKRNIPKITDDDVISFNKMMKATYSMKERGVLSDMFENYSVRHGGGTYPFGIGHGKTYATSVGATEREAFAEMTEAVIANEDALRLIEQFLPNAYSAYQEMIRGAL